MVTAAQTLLTHLDELVPAHLDLYEDLHSHPELSFQGAAHLRHCRRPAA
ncbi:hypothetical protein [Janibacter limosus]